MIKMAGVIAIASILSVTVLNSCQSGGGIKDDSSAYGDITSVSVGIYHENEEALVRAGFINAVNRWLRRYFPRMISRSDNYVKMQAKYDYLYNLELFLKEGVYEVVVTFVQTGRRPPRDAQGDAVHLSTGILKVMEDYIANRVTAGNPAAEGE
jgi:hypothetical protein